MFTVVIPSKNAANLQACVESLNLHEPGCDIIAVDDGLAQIPADVHALQGVKPFIYARNINIGIRAAGENDVILLNDDTRLLTPSGFTELAKVGRDFGITSAAMTGAVGNVRQLRRSKSDIRLESTVLVFVCVFIPRRVINEIGMLDERFICYGWEDNDYCRRVLNAGQQLAIFDGCLVEHGVLPSTYRGHGAGDIRPNQAIFNAKWGAQA